MMVRCVMLHCVVSLCCGLSCFVMWQYDMICCVTLSCVAENIHIYIYVFISINVYIYIYIIYINVYICYGM